MPWYDYQCTDCDTVFEEKRAYSQANDPAVCPKCFSRRTDKMLVRANVIGVSTKAAEIPVPMSRPAAGGCGCGACGCGI